MEPKPYAFQINMPDDIQFNYEVILDLSWIEPRPHRPVLHTVDPSTHFSEAKFVRGESAEDVWNTLVTCWISPYVGFPDILTHDFGKCFTSDFFQIALSKFGVKSKEVSSE